MDFVFTTLYPFTAEWCSAAARLIVSVLCLCVSVLCLCVCVSACAYMYMLFIHVNHTFTIGVLVGVMLPLSPSICVLMFDSNHGLE